MNTKSTFALVSFLFLIEVAGCSQNQSPEESFRGINEPSKRLSKIDLDSTDQFKNGRESFEKAKELILANHFDRHLDENLLYFAATQGMMAILNGGAEDDRRWNKLLTPTELKEMEKEEQSEFAGIGVAFDFVPETGSIHVFSVIPNSPAERNDIQVEDQIISVNGKTYHGKQIIDVVRDIRGHVGDSIYLKILRGDRIISKSFSLERISWNPVEWKVFPNHIGLLSISYFGEKTTSLIEKAIAEFKRLNTAAIVVDLRDNDGGLFEKAIEASELFLPKGKVIAKVLSPPQKVEAIISRLGSLVSNVQLAIIVNKNTAAGAELFASTLIENRQAILIGERTAGKWNVQRIDHLPNGFAIKQTVKEFQSSSGKSYNKIGLDPDIEVTNKTESQYRRAQALNDFNKRLNADPQLKAAFRLMSFQVKK